MNNKKEAQRQPAEVYPPGVYIREEMKERGWSEDDLVEKAQLGQRHATQILNGNCKVDPFVAELLATAFDVSAEFFINLQSAYDQYEQFTKDLGDAMIKELYEQLAEKDKQIVGLKALTEARQDALFRENAAYCKLGNETIALEARIDAAVEVLNDVHYRVIDSTVGVAQALSILKPTPGKEGE